MEERRSPKPNVGGSNPSPSTMKEKKEIIDIVDSAEEHDKRYIKRGRNTAAFSKSGEILERKTRAPYREVRESEGRRRR